MTNRTENLAALAQQMGLTPAEAIALPATIKCAAQKVGMTEGAFIWQTTVNQDLNSYIAGICKTVSDQV